MKKFARIKKVDSEGENPKDSEDSLKDEVSQVSEDTENKEEVESIDKTDTPKEKAPKVEGKVEQVNAASLVGTVPEYTGADPLAGETIEPQPEEGEEGETLGGGITNEHNEVFDPEIHAVNPDGTPKLTKKGHFSKKRGRRAGAAKSGYLEGEDLNNAEAKAAAATYFAIFKNAGSLLIDPEFSEHTKEEGEMVTKALEAVCIENQSTGLTANQMLGAALVSYTAPRVTTPTAKDRFKLYYIKLTGLFKKKKKNVPAVEVEEPQQPADTWPSQ